MNDTTNEMHQYQYNLIMGKTREERFGMGLEMIETGREFMIMGIKMQNPDMKENEILFIKCTLEVIRTLSLHGFNITFHRSDKESLCLSLLSS